MCWKIWFLDLKQKLGKFNEQKEKNNENLNLFFFYNLTGFVEKMDGQDVYCEININFSNLRDLRMR